MMRVVNLAHGGFYLLGGYVAFNVGRAADSWALGLFAAAVAVGVLGLAMHQILLAFATAIGHDILVMVNGRIEATLSASELLANEDLQNRYLGVA